MAKSSGKSERLAAALRENLKRRKARARALENASPPDTHKSGKAPPEIAPEDAAKQA